jgi:radical SAM superfamily enzyme YgiQ (UPF0313 family)
VKHPRVLLINPYIYDVSAYSFWSAPLGLLYVGGVLRRNGMEIDLIDLLTVDEAKRKADGRVPFMRSRAATPDAASEMRKRFKRYGATEAETRALLGTAESPDLILVTCAMTYWYVGAREVIGLAREAFPDAKIVLGGLYPSLCREHATEGMGADLVIGMGEMGRFYRFVEEKYGLTLFFKPGGDDLPLLPYPSFDLYDAPFFVPLLTSLGCVHRCTYCATPYLRPRIVRRSARAVLEEIRHWQGRGVANFAFYDDSLLADKEIYAKPLLRGVRKLGGVVSFHNPNAVNASMIDQETAELMREAGFSEVRLGLETSDGVLQARTGGKVTRGTFERAIGLLKGAGFRDHDIRAYVLAGLPLQWAKDVRQTIEYVGALGVQVNLAQYSPIPHTPLFEEYRHVARHPVAEEPLFQNNSLFPFAWEEFSDEDLDELKAYARALNSRTTVI